MGTRNLTMVRLNGKLKVAQYGQWDGYPMGQGVTIAEFVQAYLMQPELLAEFKVKVAKLKFATEKQLTAAYAKWEETEKKCDEEAAAGHMPLRFLLDEYKSINRDTGAKILGMIFYHREPKKLRLADQAAFLSDTLFCEWAYCLDLNKQVVEVYKGDTAPAVTIPFSEFTVFAMRTLEAKLRDDYDPDAA